MLLQAAIIIVCLSGLSNCTPDKCIDRVEFKTHVKLEDVPVNDWQYLGDGQYKGMTIKTTEADIKDIDDVKNSCKWRTVVGEQFDYSKAFKKITFSKNINDTLIAKQNGGYYFLGDCREVVKMEIIQSGGNYLWTLRTSMRATYPAVAIYTSPQETRKCFEDRLQADGSLKDEVIRHNDLSS